MKRIAYFSPSATRGVDWRRVRKDRGFTIVELLIVIVVIAILAAITVVAYNGIQARGRDSARKNDLVFIKKALELYYIDNGRYPSVSCASGCKINGAWVSTSDGSWSNLAAVLVPKYISKLPSDPQASTATNPALGGGYNYDYYNDLAPLCGKSSGQSYILTYRLENEPQKYEISGNCSSGSQPTDYGPSSEYASTK